MFPFTPCDFNNADDRLVFLRIWSILLLKGVCTMYKLFLLHVDKQLILLLINEILKQDFKRMDSFTFCQK